MRYKNFKIAFSLFDKQLNDIPTFILIQNALSALQNPLNRFIISK